MPVRGMIFDLDGTLVDSQLDFAAIRREMQISTGQPILEAIATLDEPHAARCRDILHRHEREGAHRARLMLGVAEFLAAVDRLGLRRAVLTRNSRAAAEATLSRLELTFDAVVAREDAPPKPDPAAIWAICDAWGAAPAEVIVIGDYRFDLEAGRSAGARTVLYTAGEDPAQIEYAHLADYCLSCFTQGRTLLSWLGL